MAYDEEFAARIRNHLGGGAGVTERKMFGGLGFLVGGNMAVAASGQGGLLVRIDPADFDQLVVETSARPMEMRGREMRGWLRVDADAVRGEGELREWIDRGVACARSLPPKQQRSTASQ